MRHSDQVQMVRRLFAHIQDGTTTYADQIHRNPVSVYTCVNRLAAEQAALFRQTPLLIGMGNRIPKPGDFITEDVSGLPLLICRDRDHQIRAFVNICRHRGARLVEGCGHANRFSCPYHAWTYRLDGSLQTVPSARDFESINKAEFGLKEIAVLEHHGLIFVQPQSEGGSDGDSNKAIDPALGELADDLVAYGFDSFHHYRSLTIQRKMNWKLCPETFMEGYHLQYLHRDSVGPIFFSNLMAFDSFGRHSRLTLPRRRILELKDRPEDAWRLIPETAIIYTFFPNVTFVVQAGHVEMWRSYPDGSPDRCRIEVSVYTPEPVVTDKAKAYYEKNIDLAIRTVVGEDFPLSEGIQQGHMTGLQDHVTYGRNEPALIHYCQSIEAAV